MAFLFATRILSWATTTSQFFEFKKFKAKILATHVRKVPLLNIGMEPRLDPNRFSSVEFDALPTVKYEETKALHEEPWMSNSQFKEALGNPVIAASGIQKLEIPILEPQKKVTVEKLASLRVFGCRREAIFCASRQPYGCRRSSSYCED